MIGTRVAEEVIERYGTNELKPIARGEGVKVIFRHPWPARFEELIVGKLVLLPRDIPTPERRTRIAHALGHHFLHTGNQVWFRGMDPHWNRKQERQAEEFAAWLTIPSLEDAWLDELPPEAIARRYVVTAELVNVRLGLM